MNTKTILKDIHKYNTSEQSPGFLVRYASNLWQNSIEKALQPFLLSYSQFVVLATLGWLTRNGQPATIEELIKKAEFSQHTASEVVRDLAAKKLIELVQIIERQTVNILVTAEGSKILGKACIAVEKTDHSFFKEELIDQEVEDIIHMLFRKITKKDDWTCYCDLEEGCDCSEYE